MAVIRVTRLRGEPMVINAELIETAEATPDTILTFTTGRKMVVRESPEEIARLVLEYKRAVLARSPSAS